MVDQSINNHLEAENRVAAGAAFMDEYFPDWEDDIDINQLDIRNGCDCVLGQIATKRFGLTGGPNSPYVQICELLNLDPVQQRCLGFVSTGMGDLINMIWREQIIKRQEAKAEKEWHKPKQEKAFQPDLLEDLPCMSV